MTYIDKDAIENIIDEVGTDVEVYLPNYTVDASGNTVMNYLTDPIHERALIRPRTRTNILNESGAQKESDSLAYFKANSKIQSEAEIHVKEGIMSDNGITTVYYAISVQPSVFEGEVKFLKIVCQGRRF